ncbi:hypothetical protein ABIB62_001570 [Mucilaginibacter sp. UYP25]
MISVFYNILLKTCTSSILCSCIITIIIGSIATSILLLYIVQLLLSTCTITDTISILLVSATALYLIKFEYDSSERYFIIIDQHQPTISIRSNDFGDKLKLVPSHVASLLAKRNVSP